jgi:hypothetical protein
MRASRRMSELGTIRASWFETAQVRLLTMRVVPQLNTPACTHQPG